MKFSVRPDESKETYGRNDAFLQKKSLECGNTRDFQASIEAKKAGY